ncbi:hypothetical protein B0A54_06952 [Friedmanniomyces endolithicus]|uniref:Uncharacterized protein n=1 Tax=Friedmanniomyces endolithicus TaxID=329885 RepID=A0A4U0V2P9_9PEZI|nr:hypothetical protein B0A54_06952 [Friedmanniomyces endolithicus]
MSKHSPQQDLSQLSPGDSTLEAKEHSASGSASVRNSDTDGDAPAGINLNVFGALAGAFSGKSTKETAADGGSVEYREDEGRVKGNLEAVGAAQGEEKGREVRQAVKEK